MSAPAKPRARSSFLIMVLRWDCLIVALACVGLNLTLDLAGQKANLIDYLTSASFEDLVGAGQEFKRDSESDQFSAIQVDDQFDFCRLMDWQIRWLFTI